MIRGEGKSLTLSLSLSLATILFDQCSSINLLFTMLLLSAGRSALLLSSTLRQLATALLSREGGVGSSRNGIEHRASSSTSSCCSSFSASPSPRSRRALSTSPCLGSKEGGAPADPASSKWHPTEEAESHSSVPEGATLAEEGEERAVAAAASASSSPSPLPPPPPRRNKKTSLPLPSLDPLRTADALWPQSNAQRRVGQRVHRALQALLSQPRSATLPEGVSRRLLGSGPGGGCGLALAGARASPDGKSVFILYDCSPGAEEAAKSALRAAAGPLRAAVSRVAGFKKVPRLVFVRDGEGGGGGGGGKRESGRGNGGEAPLAARRRERSGGTVGEIEAEMARLGLLGGGEGGDFEEEEETGEEEEEEEEGESRGSRL